MLRIVLDLPGGVVTMFERGGLAVAGDRARSYMRAVANRLAGTAPARTPAPASADYALHYAQNPADLGEHSWAL